MDAVFRVVGEHFKVWIRKHHCSCRFARRYDDSDLFQEAALRALERLGTVKARSTAELLAWFDEILLHKTTELWRHDFLTKKRDASRDIGFESAKGEDALRGLVDGHTDPCREVQRREQSKTIQDALSELPPRERRLIELRFYDALAYETISERVQQTPEAVRSALRRILDKLILRVPPP